MTDPPLHGSTEVLALHARSLAHRAAVVDARASANWQAHYAAAGLARQHLEAAERDQRQAVSLRTARGRIVKELERRVQEGAQ